MKSALSFFWEIGKIGFLALVIVAPLRLFVFQPFLVKGESMEPNFHDGDYLIVDELSYRVRMPERGEVIVFKFPQDPSQRYIKRIVGLPGEEVTVNAGKVFVKNNEGTFLLDEPYIFSETPGTVEMDLKDNEYFVLGDNRRFSSDSRKWGVLPEEFIIGKTMFRLFPLNVLAKVERPNY